MRRLVMYQSVATAFWPCGDIDIVGDATVESFIIYYSFILFTFKWKTVVC